VAGGGAAQARNLGAVAPADLGERSESVESRIRSTGIARAKATE
jgi:hypothetical protein